MLRMDCTKGHNLLSQEWVLQALRKAGLPNGLVRMVIRIMRNDSILVINRVNHDSYEPFAGLTKGCTVLIPPCVCDWPLAAGTCETPLGPHGEWIHRQLVRISVLIQSFEVATWQKINGLKYATTVNARNRFLQ